MTLDFIIGVACTILGAVLGYVAFLRNAKSDSKADGKQDGTILTELGYIKGGIDEIKAEQREQRQTARSLIT